MKHFILGENDKDTIRRLRQQNEHLKQQLDWSLNEARKNKLCKFYLFGNSDLIPGFKEYLRNKNLTINDII